MHEKPRPRQGRLHGAHTAQNRAGAQRPNEGPPGRDAPPGGPRHRDRRMSRMRRRRPSPRDAERRLQASPKTRKSPQGGDPPAGLSRRARCERPARRRRPCAQSEKRPPRARRPALPQPGAAVLSAKAGLTAGFGMGPGDPRLCGRARGGRSPAASLWSLPGPLAGATLAAAWRARTEDRASRSVLSIEDAKSSGY